MALVTELTATIRPLSWSGADFGAEAVQTRLLATGWRATVIPRLSPPSLLVQRLRKKDGLAFDEGEGKSAIFVAASAAGTRLAALKEWAVQTVQAAGEVAKDLSPAEIARTTGRFWEKRTEGCKAQGKGALCVLGIPGWVPWVVGAGAGLYALKQVSTIASLFGGRRRKP